MNYKAFVSPLAKVNIEDGIYWYEEKQEGLGDTFFNAVSKTISYLIDNPYLFPLRKPGFRESIVAGFPYIIIYEVEGDLIIIAAVFNTYQNPGKKP